MADNITLDAGAGGSDLATDEISSVHYEKILIGYGPDGTWTRVTASAGFPIQLESGHADIKITLDGEAVVLGAGSAAFGKLASNSGVDIGDVDVLSVVPGTGATNLGKAEDAAHTSGDVGVMILGLRQDGSLALTNADGDYSPIAVDSKGRVKVIVSAIGAGLTGDNEGTSLGGTLYSQNYYYDGSTWDRIRGDSTNGALVNLGSNNDVTVTAISAGNNNIGNVDIVTLPSGNLGQQAMAASLSVVPASDITDATYIGDIKFAEAEPNSAAIKTAVEKLDDWDESDRAKVNPIAGQAGIAANAGVMSALTTRITIATDDTHYGTVGAASDIDGVIHGQLRYIADQLVTIDADTNDIKTAVQIVDNWDDAADHCEVVGADAEDANVTGKPVLIAGRYDSSPRSLDNTDAGALALTPEAAVHVAAALQSDFAYDGDTKCTVKRFMVVTSTSDTSIISAVAAKKFRIRSLALIGLSATATNVHFETKTTNTDCFGDSTNPIPVAIDADGDNHGGLVLNCNPDGWFETADANEDMAVILSAAQPVLICGTYIEVA